MLRAKEKFTLRKQALAELREELKSWTYLAKKGEAAQRKQAAELARHALKDEDFRGVRDPNALAALEEDQRREWQLFWTDVRALLTQIEAK